MAPIPDLCERPNNGTVLIQGALGAMLETAKVLVTRSDGELGDSYARLMAYCVLIRDHLDRITKGGTILGDELTESMTARLGALLTSQTTSEATNEARLRALHARLDEIRSKDSLIKTGVTESVLAFAAQHDQRTEFINFLKSWESDVRMRYPEDRSLWTAGDFAPQTKNVNPFFSVWKAAVAMFDALEACKDCGCTPMHDFGARLRLGTYHQAYADTQTEWSVDFDMFISATKDWKEVSVHTVHKKVVQFDVGTQASLQQDKNQSEPVEQHCEPKFKPGKVLKVKKLCEPILKTGKVSKVELKVMRGLLFRSLLPVRKSQPVDVTQDPVSLEYVLQFYPQAFTEKTKRILAVLLSYAVLHLHDTPWLQSTWSSSDILFFRTSLSDIRWMPFLRTGLSGPGNGASELNEQARESGDGSKGETRLDETDTYDVSTHHCPTIVALAIMLMEVYFKMPFDDLARNYKVELEEGTTRAARYLNAIGVFQACQEEIPENSQFLYAVERCLKEEIWEDEDQNRLRSPALRSKIYDEVVCLLESELSLAFPSISLSELDQLAQSLVFSSWDKAIRDQKAQYRDPCQSSDANGQTFSPRDGTEKPPARHASEYYSQHLTPMAPVNKHRFGVYPQISHSLAAGVPVLLSTLVSETSGKEVHKISNFFDDATPPFGHPPAARDKYSDWKDRYLQVYAKFITPSLDLAPVPPHVKIAVLDTGIDINHPDIRAREENIKDMHNWMREEPRSAVNDADGHGTFVTALLFDYAPDAEIYVAKIADIEPISPRVIAKAIAHAVNVWNVDMISMSFGFPSRAVDGYDELERAIIEAYSRQVLLFAAASNNGGQSGRAFPAGDDNVVCVHSTDAHGNRSHFSPTAKHGDINLATVGEAVESAWPMHLCYSGQHAFATDNIAKEVAYSAVKSGTSYATPIMTGIAAFLLLYARLNLPNAAELLQRRGRMIDLLKRIAQKGQELGLRDEYHFVDMSLYPGSLFGKEKVYIDEEIGNLLSS